MERYEEILKQIEANNSGAEKRFACLTKKIELHTEQAEKIFDALTEAFPSNKSGKPDFSGHARAHESWIREAADSKELRAYIQKVVLAGIALAVASWAGLLIWQGVLHGPVK